MYTSSFAPILRRPCASPVRCGVAALTLARRLSQGYAWVGALGVGCLVYGGSLLGREKEKAEEAKVAKAKA